MVFANSRVLRRHWAPALLHLVSGSIAQAAQHRENSVGAGGGRLHGSLLARCHCTNTVTEIVADAGALDPGPYRISGDANPAPAIIRGAAAAPRRASYSTTPSLPCPFGRSMAERMLDLPEPCQGATVTGTRDRRDW